MKIIRSVSTRLSNVSALLGRDDITRTLKTKSSNKIPKGDGNGIILVETQQPLPNQVALSKFLPVAMNFFDANVVGYSLVRGGKYQEIKQQVRHYFSFLNHISSSRHINISASPRKNSKYEKIFEQFISGNPSKHDLENWHYRDVLVGDLIYDLYLRNSKEMTINLSDPYFKIRFLEILEYFDKTLQYIYISNVVAICVSHTVYHFAVPARIGLSLGISVFQVNHESIYRVDHRFPYAFTDFKNYRSLLSSIDSHELDGGREIARLRLDRRIAGEVVDMPYFTKESPFTKVSGNFGFEAKENFRVLVLLHDFYDSPHVYGSGFFPDFLEWLTFLAGISEHCAYEWYLKPHPNALKDPTAELKDRFKNVSSFSILEPSLSNNSLKAMGIDVALTVYGSVGHELPYIGIPVINASLNNPHADFSFAFTPENKNQYKEILLNLEDFSYPINKEEILEYYFIHYIYNLDSWLIDDYANLLKDIGGYGNLFTVDFVKKVFEKGRIREDLETMSAIREFLVSDSVRIYRKHFKGVSH